MIYCARIRFIVNSTHVCALRSPTTELQQGMRLLDVHSVFFRQQVQYRLPRMCTLAMVRQHQ